MTYILSPNMAEAIVADLRQCSNREDAMQLLLSKSLSAVNLKQIAIAAHANLRHCNNKANTATAIIECTIGAKLAHNAILNK